MRSHSHTSPPALPPLLNDLSTYLQIGDRSASTKDHEVSLVEVDPDTSRLLPPQHQPHRVRIQGKLAIVRTVSVANLKSSDALSLPRENNARSGFGQRRGAERRRRSLDNKDDTEDYEVGARDKQLRGYGIGGAGNIRRPTDVMGGPSRTSGSLLRLFARPGSGSGSSSSSTTPPTSDSERKRWDIDSFFGRVGDHKRKHISKPTS
ncbi:hypothetical protein F4810DRAFT_714531 [Camillea tinctor]|nr:hypothetical protein F4810DRAFT_714531 [Camillea tinctor]